MEPSPGTTDDTSTNSSIWEGTRCRPYTPKPDDIVRKWYVVDASGKPLGRLATEVARPQGQA